jgi:hypothetical protein
VGGVTPAEHVTIAEDCLQQAEQADSNPELQAHLMQLSIAHATLAMAITFSGPAVEAARREA